ncbi:flippase-like domain-containing protein [Lutimonas saemankumensis]|uniref:lysylphosphatidylglycerol synthase domain-containing protein n=1 Tax=Lutimonas saemankumensis TaxID=483016 RepID=UPI001CD27FE3|nr:lysylphosphatidylglycerol synthase domain-containing protein [Lutimonas saemankumensis]MCA0933373.1 flippase-like domain-containing protein [Lutimonas saemankumensis]
MQKYFSSLLFIIKLLILSGAYYIISQRLFNEKNFNGSLWTDQLDSMGSAGLVFMLVIVFLSLVNWTLEVIKWKTLIKSLRNISFSESLEQSLGSLTASLITPNRIGEYGAKAIYYTRKQRPQIMLRNFIGNASQMTVTVVFGIFSLIFLQDYLPEDGFRYTEYFILITSILVLLSCVFYWFLLRTDHNSWLKKVKNFFRIRVQEYQKALTFSVFRYLVFSHQFYLLLIFFGVDISYSVALPTIFLMYFIASAIPGFVLFDWLVKGSVAVTLFGYLGVSEIVILCITTTMWILNFAFPAMIGSVYVIRFNPRFLTSCESKIIK